MSSKHFLLLTITKTCANWWHFSSARGYAVLEAPTARMAIHGAIEGNPNLILLDLRLADMNGIEVARQLQNSGNNTHPRHCLDCGLSSPSRIARPCSDQAYSTVFQKPVSLRELEATVARCLYPYRMIPKEHLGRRRPADKFFRERLRTAIPNFAPLIQKRPFCDILTTPAPFTKRAQSCPKLSHA